MHTIPNTHKLYVIGDYHGEIELLTENFKTLSSVAEPSSVVFLGDYDVYTAARLIDFRELLNQHDIDCYLMRGNHDNPNLWQDREISKLLETSRFKLLEDVDVIEWRGKRILTVGGAVSVDRTCARFDKGHCWPKSEGITTEARTIIKRMVKVDGPFDTLLSHTGPLTDVPITNPFTESYASTDTDLLADIQLERDTITQIQVISCIKEHYFGHFHRNWESHEYGLSMRCLDICQFAELYSPLGN